MKKTKFLILAFCLLLFCCHENIPADDLKTKMNKIWDKLVNDESLPPRIIKTDSLIYRNPEPALHAFELMTARSQNNKVDSMVLFITTINSGLMRFAFSERYFKNDNSFSYRTDKNGEIVYAYHEVPILSDTMDETTLSSPPMKSIVEIDLASKDSSLKNPDKKIIEQYNIRLKMTIEELYSMLFKP